MMSWHRPLLLVALLGGLLAFQAPFSSATYSGTSTSFGEVTAANDWTPPTVSVTSPGTVVNGTVTVSATAADDRSAVASVVVEYAAADSSTWTAICTDTTTPYSCAWNTTGLIDGIHQLRARATDTVGLQTTSDVVSTRVANSVAVIVSESGDPVRGNVPLTASVVNAPASVVTSLRVQYLNGSTWTAITGCSNTFSTTLSCTWSTSGAGSVDVRAIAVLGGTTYTDVTTYEVDNVAPVVALSVPTGTLRGTVDLTATASDVDTAVDTVLFEYRRVGTTTWTSCGLANSEPYDCSLATGGLANGSYEFRATATDVVGNTTVTATQTRTVDNTVASTSITSPLPGATVRGTVTVTADAVSSLGVTSVRIESRLVGGTFATICTDTTAPYSCSWNTSGTLSGQFELRSVLTQTGGATVTSATVTVTVDNVVLRAQDVQGTNVGTLGTVNAGDKVTLTYSTVVDLTTIKAGWTGSSTSLAAVLKDKSLAGASAAGYDRLEFTDANLGQVAFAQNFIRKSRQTTLASTMTAATVTIAGVPVTVVTITLGAPANSSFLPGATSTSGSMRWTPSAAAKSPTGIACSTTLALETGTSDRDL